MLKSQNDYTDDWKAGITQQTVKQRANHQCEECGLEFNPDNNLSKKRCAGGRLLNGGCHHIDHNRANDDLNNIVFLCQRCHVRLHGADWRPGSPLLKCWRNKPPKWIVARNIPYQTNPQLALPIE